MARVTVEDCIEKINNRFELIIVASQRARELSNGAPVEVERDNDKNPVVSLREIASGSVTQADLQERFIRTLQKINPNESEEEEEFSKEDEFAAYINETTLSTEKEITPSSPINHSSSRNEDEIFEDVADEIVRKEE